MCWIALDRLCHLAKNDVIDAPIERWRDVQEAYYEPSGHVSVISKCRVPHVVNVEVKEGVQTVRIELQH